MAKRIYELPVKEILTKDQRRALRLKDVGQYLIVGAPGTGKSIVALYRADDLKNRVNVVFLTFNHVLREASAQLLKGDLNCNTAMSWFYELYWKQTGGEAATFEDDRMPEREAHKPDYKEVSRKFKALGKDFSDHLLIIDEGQDLPLGWYESLQELEYENFFIVADQNQQITDENSSRKDLEEALALEPKKVIKLNENFRNTTPIAMFANCFYADRSSPLPTLPDKPSVDYPILYEFNNISQICNKILSEYDRDPSKLVGLFVPNDNKREWYVRELQKDHLSGERKNPKPIVSTYSSEQKSRVCIDFSYGGIVVLNDKSVKGIEFDIVFIIIDDFKKFGNDDEWLKKRLYVMTSRAKERLFLFQGQRPSVVDDFLRQPEDDYEFTDKNGKLHHVKGSKLLKRVKL